MPKKLFWLVLIISLVCSVSLIWAGGAQEQKKPAAEVGEGFSWTRYSGSRIVVNFPSNLAYNYIASQVGEFEALTGIKVEPDVLQYMRLHDKQVLELIKPTGDYDVISLVVMWKTEYVAGDMLTEIEPFFGDPNLAMPDYDFDDLVPAYVDNTGRVGGEKIYMGGPGSKLYCIPFSAETSILTYRKDILDKYGFAVPETYDDLRKVMKGVSGKEPGLYGLTMRGASGHQATHGFLNHINPFGGKIFDKDWNPIVNSPDAIRTLEFMKEVVKYGPPGIPGFSAGSMDESFLQGQAALHIDHDKIAGLSRDPAQSKVDGKVGFALHPKGKIRSSETGGFGVGIPANSQNKEAAFLFIQWMTTKEMTRKVAIAGGTPNRLSTYVEPDLVSKFPEFPVIQEQLKYADPDWRPIVPEWGEINQTIGVAVNQVLTGEKQPKEAMDAIMQPIRDIMERAGYYKK